MGLLLELSGGLSGSEQEHGLSHEQLLLIGRGGAVEGHDDDVGQLRNVTAS